MLSETEIQSAIQEEQNVLDSKDYTVEMYHRGVMNALQTVLDDQTEETCVDVIKSAERSQAMWQSMSESIASAHPTLGELTGRKLAYYDGMTMGALHVLEGDIQYEDESDEYSVRYSDEVVEVDL